MEASGRMPLHTRRPKRRAAQRNSWKPECMRAKVETTDQPAFSAMFSMEAAHRRCRSFRKLTSSFGALLRAMGHEVTPWPPAAWTEEG